MRMRTGYADSEDAVGYNGHDPSVGTGDTHSVSGVCPILIERTGDRDDTRLSAEHAVVGRHSRETLAAVLEKVELNLVEDFRACSAPAAESERIATEMGWSDLAM